MAKEATNKKQKSPKETLWDSANKLLGSVEPSEYKHVILSLIFLKFASEKFEHRRQELREMSPREFWNLAGRVGRMNHDSVGVVGIAAGNRPEKIVKYVSRATGELVSCLVKMLDEFEEAGKLNELEAVFQHEQWEDFRCYVVHLWNEKKNLDAVLSDTEQLLRNTFGYGLLESHSEQRQKAQKLLEVTRQYVRTLSNCEPTEVLIKDDLRGYLKTRYEADCITPGEIDSIVRKLEVFSASDLYESNKAIMKMVSDGFLLKREDYKKDLYIQLIDYRDLTEYRTTKPTEVPTIVAEDTPYYDEIYNIYKIVNQLKIAGYEKRIPDAILYINGLPLAVFEFKSAIREKATIHDARVQLIILYRRDIPELFKYTDWSQRDDIKAELKVALILLLAKNDYPPVDRNEVYKEIFEQAENFKRYQGAR